MATYGNVLRLTASFYNLSNALTDVTGSVTLKILEAKSPYTQIGGDITVGIVHDSTGLYHYDYTVPMDSPPSFIYEFSGTVAGSPAVGRAKISLSFTTT